MKRFVLMVAAAGSLFSISDDVLAQSRNANAVKVAPTQNQPCLLCDWEIPTQATESMKREACFDFEPVACESYSSQSFREEYTKTIHQKLSGIVDQARLVGAQAMGFQDLRDGFVRVMSEQGMIVNEEFKDQLIHAVYMGDAGLSSLPLKIFNEQKECDLRRNEWSAKVNQLKDLEKLKELLAEVKKERVLEEQNRLKIFAQSLPLLTQTLGTKCLTFRSMTEEQKNYPQNEIFKTVCGRFNSYRGKAIDLYHRKEGDELAQKSKELVDELKDVLTGELTFVPPATQSYNTDYSISGGPANFPAYPYGSGYPVPTVKPGEEVPSNMPVNPEYEQMQKRFELSSQVNQELFKIRCENTSQRWVGIGKAAWLKTLRTLISSRPVVESLLNAHFTSERKLKIEKMRENVVRLLPEVLKARVADGRKLAQVKSLLKEIVLDWPSNNKYVYKKDDRYPVEVIDDLAAENFFTKVYFADPLLSFFVGPNAVFSPQMVVGVQKNKNKVLVFPYFLEFGEKNPLSVLSILAHEISHSIDPITGKMQNLDMTREYSTALQCLSEKDAIAMLPAQAGESISDLLSAEVMARLVAQMPQEKRVDALLTTMGGFCLMNTDEFSQPIGGVTHPRFQLRIGGVFGSNKSVRKVLNCEPGAPSKYRQCGL